MQIVRSANYLCSVSPMPLFCLAPLAWYAEALKVSRIPVGEAEAFPKQTCRNRIVIPTANNIKTMSIPIDGSTKHRSYKDVKISYAENWTHQWVHTLETAYGKSPFYEFYGYRLDEVLLKKHVSLYDLNMELLLLTLKLLQSDAEVYETGEKSEDMWEQRQVLMKPYVQVFTDRHGFQPEVSIADLLFNLGPNSLQYLLDAGA